MPIRVIDPPYTSEYFNITQHTLPLIVENKASGLVIMVLERETTFSDGSSYSNYRALALNHKSLAPFSILEWQINEKYKLFTGQITIANELPNETI